MTKYWYLGSPYSKYKHGIEEAYREVCRNHAILIEAGIPSFCPIGHTHGPAVHGGIDPLDHTIWIPADQPFMDLAYGLIVCKMDGWEESYGLNIEISFFRDNHKPVVYMTPGQLPKEFQHYAAESALAAE